MDQFHVTYGPPGCGKTTNMAKWAQRYVGEYGSHSVLIASLTKAAAEEIRSRDTGVSRENVGTLHSLCLRELGAPGIAEVEAKKWNEAQPRYKITPASEDLPEKDIYQRKTLFDINGDDLLAECGLMRAQMIPEDRWQAMSSYGSYLMRFWKLWCEWKNDCGFLDFTDLIAEALDKCRLPPRGARVLLFDEAQDYSRLEFALCLQWGEHADHVRFTGDPDQNLYEWRGADPHVFMDIESKSVLGQSYRVPREICAKATRWIRQIKNRDDVVYKPTEGEGEVIRRWSTWRNPFDDLYDLIPECEELGEDLMVLTSCNYMLGPAISELRRRGIKFHNPFRRKNGAWNPMRIGGKRTTAADRLITFMNLPNENDPATIHEWLEPLKADILTRGAKKRARDLEVGLDLGAIRDLFLSESDYVRALEGDVAWYVDNVIASKRKPFVYPAAVVNRYALDRASSSARIDALKSPPRVIVGTCHSVKGGEADRVLLYPNISFAASQQMLGDPDPIIRQFYVGMTRAKQTLYLAEPVYGFKHHTVEWL